MRLNAQILRVHVTKRSDSEENYELEINFSKFLNEILLNLKNWYIILSKQESIKLTCISTWINKFKLIVVYVFLDLEKFNLDLKSGNLGKLENFIENDKFE